ncbi:SIR2 family protein [Legionella pneumophila serogroup 1]
MPLNMGGLHPTNDIFSEYREMFIGTITEYQDYSNKKINEINIEEFIEYIDYQSFLNFYGTLNYPSKQGNDIQKVIRVLIATVLLKKQEQALNTNLYNSFAETLTNNDIVITLNYDTLIEYFLQKNGKKFRLLPPWIYKDKLNFEPYDGVTLLKVHGSINWFNLNEYYEKQRTDNLNNPHSLLPADFIFNNHGNDKPKLNPIVPMNIQPTIETNLKYLYWVSDQDLNKFIKVYNNPLGRTDNNEAPAITHPILLSPSYSKLLYSDSIKDLFYGAGFYGCDNDQIIIIGCSLVDYDKYIRQWVFDIVRQYRGMNHTKEISVINYASRQIQKIDIQKTYSYLGTDKIKFIFDGFSEKSLAGISN